jgi:hypothetical protein
MLRHQALLCTLLSIASPVAAQDVLGPVNPVDYMPAITMGSAIEADVRSSSRRRAARSRSVSDAQTCRELPMYRSKLGANDSRIVRLTRACRRAGYR